LQNSFGSGTKQLVRLTNIDFCSAIFVGGDFKRTHFDIEGKAVDIMIRGEWAEPVTQDKLVNILQKTIEGHTRFWQDYSDTIYSVVLIPVEDSLTWTATNKSVSVGGSGLTNSFMAYATNNPGLRLDQMRYIFVHELMHHWIGGKIRNAHEEQQYWFSEGFTEYFTLKNSLKYGLIDEATFISQLNDEFTFPLYQSPYRNMPNDSINYSTFWRGDEYWKKLPYRRGCLYAFYLDNQIRTLSNGEHNLDDLMRDILRQCMSDPDQTLSQSYFVKQLRKYAGRKSAKEFKRFIERGELIDFVSKSANLPAGLTAEVKDVKMQFGPSPDIIDRVEVFKDMLVFKQADSTDLAKLRAALLR
jgi:predicted metalloprotease with PDZ domain